MWHVRGRKYRLLGCSRKKRLKETIKWEDNIKIGLNEIGKKGVDSMKLAPDREE
jgi:hypothetical protein